MTSRQDKDGRGRLSGRVTRRGLLKGSAASGVAALGSYGAGAQEVQAEATRSGEVVDVSLTINGADHSFTLDARTTILYLLR